MNVKKNKQQIFKSDIKSGNVLEIKGDSYYLIIDSPSSNNLLLYNLSSLNVVNREFTVEEIYEQYNVTAIYTNSDLILK